MIFLAESMLPLETFFACSPIWNRRATILIPRRNPESRIRNPEEILGNPKSEIRKSGNPILLETPEIFTENVLSRLIN